MDKAKGVGTRVGSGGGWGGGEWWEENGDNYTWTIIKKCGKKDKQIKHKNK